MAVRWDSHAAPLLSGRPLFGRAAVARGGNRGTEGRNCREARRHGMLDFRFFIPVPRPFPALDCRYVTQGLKQNAVRVPKSGAYSTLLNYTALHYTRLHYTAPHRTTPHYTRHYTLHCSAQYTALRTALHYSSLLCPSILY